MVTMPSRSQKVCVCVSFLAVIGFEFAPKLSLSLGSSIRFWLAVAFSDAPPP